MPLPQQQQQQQRPQALTLSTPATFPTSGAFGLFNAQPSGAAAVATTTTTVAQMGSMPGLAPQVMQPVQMPQLDQAPSSDHPMAFLQDLAARAAATAGQRLATDPLIQALLAPEPGLGGGGGGWPLQNGAIGLHSLGGFGQSSIPPPQSQLLEAVQPTVQQQQLSGGSRQESRGLLKAAVQGLWTLSAFKQNLLRSQMSGRPSTPESQVGKGGGGSIVL